ncbi:hypothetical protein LIN78_15265 [Leeia sp. TBRC 13508]|uniref:RiboL-PSP-HEPN domain-containing protein n=1 Tax=Leeia speluncae TaxID=2884804 RepID=A0ABS8D9L9_9NEIS|nr:hypothetical protein [Leeia speluncae]MCB6184906.1 hypothetical protein [Leeia speluncae]
MAERNSDSYTESYESVICESCGADYDVTIMNSFGGADVYVNNGDINSQNSGPYYSKDDDDDEVLYWKNESPEHYRVLNDHLDSASELLKVAVNERNRFSLNVMIYGHVVAAAEGFLSSIFIKTTVGHEELIRKLVETDPKFSDMKFTLSQLFKEREQIKDTVAKYLHDLIFHDLKKIKPMYKDVLGHDFGDISWLFKAVAKRHHCVHRAGHDKDGTPIVFAENEVLGLIEQIKKLAAELLITTNKLEDSLSLPF